MILSWQPPQPVEQLVSFCTSANSFSTSEKCALLCRASSMSAKVTCLQLQITVFSVYSILLEVAVQQALERAAVSGFVASHLISHVAALVTKGETIYRSFSTVSPVLKLKENISRKSNLHTV